MIVQTKRLWRSSLCSIGLILNFSSVGSVSSLQILEERLKSAIQTKDYQQIPDLLNSSKECSRTSNLFSFLSDFPQDKRTRIIDDVLRSFIPLRPRPRLRSAYSFLLCYTLQSSNPLPLALSILQCTLRSGCVPPPQARLFLSSAWLEQRSQHSVADILLDMKSISYSPDSGTCNYVIASLCAVDQLGEALKVLKGMSQAGCIPDLDSYGTLINVMCSAGMTSHAVDMLKQMILKVGLTPRQDTVAKVFAALCANKEIWQTVEIVELLEREDYAIGFELYEKVVEGCMECREYVLAGKVVMGMTERGFIPYIRARQKVVEGLACVGELDLARAVRQRFIELRS